MTDFSDLFQFLQKNVAKLVNMHSEGSIRIEKNFVSIDYNYLNTRALYYMYDNQLINYDEFKLINDRLNYKLALLDLC